MFHMSARKDQHEGQELSEAVHLTVFMFQTLRAVDLLGAIYSNCFTEA